MNHVQVGLCQLFVPNNLAETTPLVLIIGGSSGGLRSQDQAEYFASNGYPAAVIPYFGMDDLPKELKEVPLEYFVECISKISSLPELRGRKKFIQGTSRGAEATLLLCAHNLVDIDGAILVSPSRYAWGASEKLEDLLDGSVIEKSTWLLNGSAVKFVPFNPDSPVVPVIRNVDGTDCLVFRDTWYPKIVNTEGEIDVSDLETKLLIFSGRDDQLWPSYRFGVEIEDALKAVGKNHLVDHVSFKSVGHQIPYPGKEPVIYLTHPQLQYSIYYGGGVANAEKAAGVWWQKVRSFLTGN